MMNARQLVERVRREYRNVEIKEYPDERLIEACRELGGEVVPQTVVESLKPERWAVEKWVCAVNAKGATHQNVLSRLARVLAKHRPSGAFCFELATGKMELATKDGHVTKFYAWYKDLANESDLISEEAVTPEELKRIVEETENISLSEDEWREVLDEAALEVNNADFDEALNDHFLWTEEWENYNRLSSLGLSMRLGTTAYGGIYPIIEGKNLSIPPEKLEELIPVFNDFEDVSGGGYGNGLLADLVQAAERAEFDMWFEAVERALRKLGFKKE